MAQFALHALLGLWIAWALPLFSPYILRVSFGAGIYFGCVFPDVDLYVAAISNFIHQGTFLDFHRNATHSVVTALVLLVIFAIIEAVVHRNRRSGHLMYEADSSNLDDDTLLALHGALSYQDSGVGINFRVFGFGMFAGICIHIMLDILFWFSPINLLYPLPMFGIGHSINAWENTDVPYVATVILTLSELLCFALFFAILRVSVVRKLGKWANDIPDDVAKRRRHFTDNDMEHASMDFSLHAQEDICPLDQKTLKRARPALFLSKILIIFQLLYFAGACAAPFIKKDSLQIVVFGEMLLVCIPLYCYLSFVLRDVILRKSS